MLATEHEVLFFTHYSVDMGMVFVRYVDVNGNRRTEHVRFQPRLWVDVPVEKSNTPIKSMFGHSLKEMRFTGPSKMRNYVFDNKDIQGLNIYGTRNPALQAVVDHFPNTDVVIDNLRSDLIRRLNIDIEITTHNSDGFPAIEDPIEEVNIISAYDTLRKKMVVFCTTDFNLDSERFERVGVPVKILKFATEVELLQRFLDFWTADYPDIVSGWNIDGFDIPYLVNRIEKILGEDAVNRLSPVGRLRRDKGKDEYGKDLFEYKIQGLEIVDTLKLYRNFELDPRESYSLENIAQIELGVGKLQHPSNVPGHNLYREQNLAAIDTGKGDWSEWLDLKELIDRWQANNYDTDAFNKAQSLFREAHALYNVIDVVRAWQIEERKDLFEIAYFVALYSWSNFSEVTSAMRFWTNLLYGYALSEGVVFNEKPPEFKKDEPFKGAFVLDPQKGRFEGVGCLVSFDFSSLYPSIIRLLNIDPATLCNQKYELTIEDALEGKLPVIDPRHAVGMNGAAFDRSEQGLLPKKVTELFMRRKAEKKASQKFDKLRGHVEAELRRRGVDV